MVHYKPVGREKEYREQNFTEIGVRETAPYDIELAPFS
jgi:hypothetical protein